MAKVVNIDHIAVVVEKNDESLNFWQNILGIDLDYKESVPSMNIDLAWLPVGKTRIELIEAKTETDNEYYDFLKKNGPGMHHICVEVDDIDEMMATLKENNIKLKDQVPQQLPGRKIAFLEPESCDGVVVELYEITK